MKEKYTDDQRWRDLKKAIKERCEMTKHKKRRKVSQRPVKTEKEKKDRKGGGDIRRERDVEGNDGGDAWGIHGGF